MYASINQNYISVILATWKEAPFIDQAVDSLLNQAGDFALEVLIVHNGGDMAWAGELKKRYDETYLDNHIADPKHRKSRSIRLLFCEKKGVSAARNLGVRELKGAWIAFCDDDDYYDLGFFENCIRSLPQYFVLQTSVNEINMDLDLNHILYVQGICQRWSTNEQGDLLEKFPKPYSAFAADPGAFVTFDGKDATIDGRSVSHFERLTIKPLSYNLPGKMISAAWFKSLAPFDETITGGGDTIFWIVNQTNMLGSVVLANRGLDFYKVRMTSDSLSTRAIQNLAKIPNDWANKNCSDMIRDRIIDYLRGTRIMHIALPGVFDSLYMSRTETLREYVLPLLSMLDNEKRSVVMQKISDNALLEFLEQIISEEELSLPEPWVCDGPPVTLVMPVYNAEPYLEKAVLAVLNQTYRNIELICVDDGSTDDSPHILVRYAEMDERMQVITQPNKGASFARNRGFAAAKGEFVMFIDADDELYSQNSLAALVSEAQRIAGADAVVGAYYIKPPIGLPYRMKKARLPLNTLIRPVDMENCFHVANAHWCYLWRRSFLTDNKLEYKAYKYVDDIDFLLQTYLAGAALYQTDVDFMLYNRGTTGSMFNRRAKEPILGFEAIFDMNETAALRDADGRLYRSWRKYLFTQAIDQYVAFYRVQEDIDRLSDFLVREYYPRFGLTIPEAIDLFGNEAPVVKFMADCYKGVLGTPNKPAQAIAASQGNWQGGERFIMRTARRLTQFVDRLGFVKSVWRRLKRV